MTESLHLSYCECVTHIVNLCVQCKSIYCCIVAPPCVQVIVIQCTEHSGTQANSWHCHLWISLVANFANYSVACTPRPCVKNTFQSWLNFCWKYNVLCSWCNPQKSEKIQDCNNWICQILILILKTNAFFWKTACKFLTYKKNYNEYWMFNFHQQCQYFDLHTVSV